MNLNPLGPPIPAPEALWQHTRNSLGIARLLVHEGRPEPLVATACLTAVEAACRAALEHAGLGFDGSMSRAFKRLSVPDQLLASLHAAEGAARLAAAEEAVGWVARYLKGEAPGHSWGY